MIPSNTSASCDSHLRQPLFPAPQDKKHDGQKGIKTEKDRQESGKNQNKLGEFQAERPFDAIGQQSQQNGKKTGIDMGMLVDSEGSHL